MAEAVFESWSDIARKEGRQEGRKEGRQEANLENARAMFAEGFKIDVISRITKIPQKTLKGKLAGKQPL